MGFWGVRARRASTIRPDLPVIPPRTASGQTVEPPRRARTERLYLGGICSNRLIQRLDCRVKPGNDQHPDESFLEQLGIKLKDLNIKF